MSYIRHIPKPPLDQYIHHLYYLDGPMPFPRKRILPNPTLDIKINLGGPFQLDMGGDAGRPQRLTESWLTGLYGVYHNLNWPAEMRLYGVRFKPHGAYPFLGQPVSEFYNQVAPLDAIWGSFATKIREQLAAAPTIQAGLARFEQLLHDRMQERPHEQKVVDYSIAEIDRQHGSLSISALSEALSISQNHLATLFKRVVGTSAKEVARIYRFEYALRSIDPTQPVNWTQIALACGYYDQSHFNHDFMAFTGYCPSRYVELRRQVYMMHAPADQSSLRILPVD